MRCNTFLCESNCFKAEQYCVKTDPLREDSKNLMLIRRVKSEKVVTYKLVSGDSNLLVMVIINVLCVPPTIVK